MLEHGVKDLIPLLIANLGDGRVYDSQYVPDGAPADGSVTRPLPVGAACERLLYRILLNHTVQRSFVVRDWPSWWAIHKDRTIGELREEAAKQNAAEYPSDLSVEGTIYWDSAIPERKVVDLNGFPACQEMYQGSRLQDDSVIVSPRKGLANVFVYVTDVVPKGPPAPVPAEPKHLRHEKGLFVPHVLGLQRGQSLEIENGDSIAHTNHLISSLQPKAEGLAPDRLQKRVFTETEVFALFRCDLHPWEKAYVGVVDLPYFAVTGVDGSFRLPPGLPPGRYVVRAQHETMGAKEEAIVVTGEKQVTRVDFHFP
jgi:hypothetical protein